MKAKLVRFGVIEIEGHAYGHDVVVEAGRIAKRDKKPSRAYQGRFGHTPLSAAEDIPWQGPRLIIGTGASGQLPIMEDVWAEARRRHVSIDARPTAEACRLIRDLPAEEVHAILHVTC